MRSHCFTFTLVIQSLLIQVISEENGFYSAVVVEYSPSLNSSLDADTNLLNNVKNYVYIIETAASLENKADIIVFPESSLVGYLNKPKFLEIPDPKDKVQLCDGGHNYEAPIVDLACAARKTRTYVVVNLSEKYYNETQNRILHFNTNVAFDRSGCVVARYRKIHLYVEGDKEASPDKELVYFDTDFGVRFGLLTCFDIVFQDPGVELAENHNVTHFIFPSAWFSQMPFLTAIQEQFYWAYTLDVVLLAAGYNMPSVGSSGSGVYLGRQGPLTYSMAEQRGSFMLQAYVPIQYPHTGEAVTRRINKTTTTKLKLQHAKEELHPKFLTGLDLLRSHNVLKTKQDYLDVFETELILPNSDLHLSSTVQKISIPVKIEKQLCQNEFCCSFLLNLSYEFSKFKEDTERGDDYSKLYYRLAVFDGVKNYDGAATGGLQTCAIIPCVSTILTSCGLRSDNLSAITNVHRGFYQSNLVFDSIQISGSFHTDQSFVGPNILLKGQEESFGLLPLSNSFMFSKSERTKYSSLFTLKIFQPTSLVTASLYGRLFSRDGSHYTIKILQESKSSLLQFRLDLVLFICTTLLAKYAVA